jgi:multisubunit Na+/H+ antiporter MnhB subunit
MATEEADRREDEQRPDDDDDTPELLIKLRERKERHQQRGILLRIAIVILGVLIVLAGAALSAPGVPGPGIAVILIGLGFLALEFDAAERLLERTIIWGDRAKDRAEETSPKQRILAGIAGALVVGAFLVAAALWDIPLLPIV